MVRSLEPYIPATSNPRYHAAGVSDYPSLPTLHDSERLGALALFQEFDTDGDHLIDLSEACSMVSLSLSWPLPRTVLWPDSATDLWDPAC